MKFIILAVCIFGACSAQNPAALAQGGGIDADRTKWTPLTCKEGLFGPNADRTAELGACAAEHGPGKKNPSCNFFCQGVALGVLNKQGVPTQEIYDTWVAESFPQQHKALATAWFRDCFQKYGKFIDLNDADCKMAKRFGDCTWEVQPNLTCPK